MVFRSSAKISGAVVALAVSVSVAQSEVAAAHSSEIVNEASGGGKAARTQPPASVMILLPGRPLSRRVYVRNLVGSNMARGRSTPSLRLSARRSSSG
jgi:hypothetical protein